MNALSSTCLPDYDLIIIYLRLSYFNARVLVCINTHEYTGVKIWQTEIYYDVCVCFSLPLCFLFGNASLRFSMSTQQEKGDLGPKRDIDGMGVPEIKYGDSVCFVMHVATGLWLSYLAPDAKSSRLGPLKRRVNRMRLFFHSSHFTESFHIIMKGLSPQLLYECYFKWKTVSERWTLYISAGLAVFGGFVLR